MQHLRNLMAQNPQLAQPLIQELAQNFVFCHGDLNYSCVPVD